MVTTYIDSHNASQFTQCTQPRVNVNNNNVQGFHP